MIKRICDRCGKEICDQPRWMLSADLLGQHDIENFERDFYCFDICDKCMRELISSFKEVK